MGRDQRPTVTRRWMNAGVGFALVAMLAGCGGNANVQASSSNGSASGSVSFPGRSSLGTLLSIVFLAGVSYESDRTAPPHSAPVPALDPSRRVIEHDCTRPIEDWSANLRCR